MDIAADLYRAGVERANRQSACDAALLAEAPEANVAAPPLHHVIGEFEVALELHRRRASAASPFAVMMYGLATTQPVIIKGEYIRAAYQLTGRHLAEAHAPGANYKMNVVDCTTILRDLRRHAVARADAPHAPSRTV